VHLVDRGDAVKMDPESIGHGAPVVGLPGAAGPGAQAVLPRGEGVDKGAVPVQGGIAKSPRLLIAPSPALFF